MFEAKYRFLHEPFLVEGLGVLGARGCVDVRGCAFANLRRELVGPCEVVASRRVDRREDLRQRGGRVDDQRRSPPHSSASRSMAAAAGCRN